MIITIGNHALKLKEDRGGGKFGGRLRGFDHGCSNMFHAPVVAGGRGSPMKRLQGHPPCVTVVRQRVPNSTDLGREGADSR